MWAWPALHKRAIGIRQEDMGSSGQALEKEFTAGNGPTGIRSCVEREYILHDKYSSHYLTCMCMCVCDLYMRPCTHVYVGVQATTHVWNSEDDSWKLFPSPTTLGSGHTLSFLGLSTITSTH